MDEQLKSILNECLGAYYEMPEEAKNHLFGDVVKKVFVEYGNFPNNKEIQLNWNEYSLPENSGLVIVLKNGKIISSMVGNDSIILSFEGEINERIIEMNDGKFESILTFRDENDSLKRMQLSKDEKITDIIENIMREYGPDRHTDGANMISSFVKKLLLLNENDKYKLLLSTNLKDFI